MVECRIFRVDGNFLWLDNLPRKDRKNIIAVYNGFLGVCEHIIRPRETYAYIDNSKSIYNTNLISSSVKRVHGSNPNNSIIIFQTVNFFRHYFSFISQCFHFFLICKNKFLQTVRWAYASDDTMNVTPSISLVLVAG